jgi:diguanylate cyclase (GGDEF)-like protein
VLSQDRTGRPVAHEEISLDRPKEIPISAPLADRARSEAPEIYPFELALIADKTFMGRPGLRATQPAPLFASVAVVAVTVAILPWAGHQLGPGTSFLPMTLSAIACFDILSAWLLAGNFLDTGDRRFLVMACAYLWSLVLMGGYVFAFPGLLSSHPPLDMAASMAAYMFVCWHAGFPILLGAAWGPWFGPNAIETLRPRRRPLLAGAAGGTTAVAGATIATVAATIHHLPVLIHGVRFTNATALVGVPLVIISLFFCVRGIRGAAGPERWSVVAIVGCLCDLIISDHSHARFTVGWYAGRGLGVLAAGVVLAAMLASFRRLKATAEFNAAYDHLTGLPNRRSAQDSLNAMFARGRRMHTALALVAFDLDFFKRINDEHGHAAGDAVLRAVGLAVRAAIRPSDMVARIGGEEFLVLLPDATDDDARVVAERLRAALRTLDFVGPDVRVTASFGVAHMQESDLDAEQLLQRADRALYGAKATGRDGVVVAPVIAPLVGQAAPTLLS